VELGDTDVLAIAARPRVAEIAKHPVTKLARGFVSEAIGIVLIHRHRTNANDSYGRAEANSEDSNSDRNACLQSCVRILLRTQQEGQLYAA